MTFDSAAESLDRMILELKTLKGYLDERDQFVDMSIEIAIGELETTADYCRSAEEKKQSGQRETETLTRDD